MSSSPRTAVASPPSPPSRSLDHGACGWPKGLGRICNYNAAMPRWLERLFAIPPVLRETFATRLDRSLALRPPKRFAKREGETPVEPRPSNPARLQKRCRCPAFFSLGLCQWLSRWHPHPEQDAPGYGHGKGSGSRQISSQTSCRARAGHRLPRRNQSHPQHSVPWHASAGSYEDPLLVRPCSRRAPPWAPPRHRQTRSAD